ncbi:MAG TPA: MBL fold metallo-hydrolase [Anaerolineales bacterium]|nr:MBL fold metallo-hydrolase [Anaerolineales bacterium]
MSIQIERVSDDIYVFTSDLYAQVTAGAVISPHGSALIDTLAFPSETRQIKSFIENTLGSKVRYIINTHYHADHIYGNYLFPEAEVISHDLCRQYMLERVVPQLAASKKETPEIREVEIVLPSITFDNGGFLLQIGNKTLVVNHAPGHSHDQVTVLVREEKVLFASDSVMPLPFFMDGSVEDTHKTLNAIKGIELENIVQGHGEVILRGEIAAALESRITYIEQTRKLVAQVIKRNRPVTALQKLTLESMERSNIELAGLVEALHMRNLEFLYHTLQKEMTPWPSARRKHEDEIDD